MKTRCPNCGAVHSLDSLINDTDAAETLKMLLELDADIGKAAIRYIGLFRPERSQLSWGRTAKLLKELLPDIQQATIHRDGITYPAPQEAWIYGFTETINARDLGRLKIPLKSHGYLYEIISNYVGNATSQNIVAKPKGNGITTKPSQTLQAAARLEHLKR